MKISSSKVKNLEADGVLFPTYRVKNPFESIGIPNKGYRYVSRTLEHHIYYLSKKLFKLIESRYEININNPRDKHLVDKFFEIISFLKQDKDLSIHCTYNWIDNGLNQVIANNAYSNRHPHRENVLEKVDMNKYGGGYGLKGPWLELFELLTFCQKEQIITNIDAINYLEYLNKLICSYGITPRNYRISKSKAGILLIGEDSPITIEEKQIEDNTHKIERTLETILSNDLSHKNSQLRKQPDETVRQITDTYQKNRILVLKSIKRQSKNS